jgi:uncharacterized membrane protein YoaK (UPF0700 family)
MGSKYATRETALIIAVTTATAPRAAQPVPRAKICRLDRSYLVVARLVGQLDQTERLQQRRHIHAEPAAVTLAQSIPTADRVGLRTSPRLDGPLGGRLVLIGCAKSNPVALSNQPGMEILDAPRAIAQPGRTHLADQRRRIGLIVAIHRVFGAAGSGRQLPRVILGAAALSHRCTPLEVVSRNNPTLQPWRMMTGVDDQTAKTPGLWRGLVADPDHGPLPLVLLALTIVTGLVDAVSILALGRVFVANMTGNVVFVGFALAKAPGFSLAASLSALAGFLVGAGLGGRLTTSSNGRPALIRAALAVELALVTAALIATASTGQPISGMTRDGIAAALAIALGVQNAIARHLKVPDLTTTVLTMTLTGIAADIRSEPRAVTIRRISAVAMMLAGAAGGALLVIHGSPADALAVGVGLIAADLAFVILWRRPWS